MGSHCGRAGSKANVRNAIRSYVRTSIHSFGRPSRLRSVLQLVELGAALHEYPHGEQMGAHFTFVDPRLSTASQMVAEARALYIMLREKGIDANKIVIGVR